MDLIAVFDKISLVFKLKTNLLKFNKIYEFWLKMLDVF